MYTLPYDRRPFAKGFMTLSAEHPADTVDKMAIERLTYRLTHIERLCETADSGHVIWEPIPSAGISQWQHNMSFVDAVMTGLGFCETRLKDEWLLIGLNMLTLIRCHPQFKISWGEETDRAMRIGTLCDVIAVYFNWQIRPDRFYMGTADKAAIGLMQHGSAVHSYRT